MQKTGSTYLQSALKRNYDALLQQNIAYFEDSYHLPLEIINAHKKGFNEALIAKVRSIVTKSVDSKKQVLFSSEGFIGTPTLHYADLNLKIEFLRKVFRDLDLTIILYVRRQDSFYQSYYIQQIHEGHTPSLSDFIERLPIACLDWWNYINKFAQIPNVRLVVRPYCKKALINHDIFDDFLNIIDVQLEEKSSMIDAHVNKSYSETALKVAFAMNKILDNDTQKWTLRKLLQNTSSQEPFSPRQIFPSHVMRKALTLHTKGNRKLIERYWQGTDYLEMLTTSKELNQDTFDPSSVTCKDYESVLCQMVQHIKIS
jgi:hypothetical protein